MADEMKLTKTVLDSLSSGERDQIYWDQELKGFGVKVTPTGRKIFLVQHRPKGHTGPSRKYTIGKFGNYTVQQARAKAQIVLHESAAGKDLGALERAKRKVKSEDRCDVLIHEFLSKHVSQNRSSKETARIFERDILPSIGKRSVHEITRRDLIEVIEAVVDRGAGVMANRVLAAVRKFFNWCAGRGIIEVSPAANIPAPTKEQPRERVLTKIEITQIFIAAQSMGFPFGPIVQLLFLTAQRRDEVGGMRWSEIDFGSKVWTIPPERIKNNKGHDVHLSDKAIDLLQALPRFQIADGSLSDLIFTTTGVTSFSGFSKGKARLDQLSGVSNWRLHDIRRTVTTELARMGVPIHVADAILNHKSGAISGVAAVYQRHEFLDERREALCRWSEQLTLRDEFAG